MESSGATRRDFLKASAAAGAMAALGSNFAHAAGSDVIKVGVIGAGGRGSGACADHMQASQISGVKSQIVAVAEMFADRAQNVKNKYKISDDKVFVGFDAYKKLLATDVDLVILATPPGFRPFHFEAAVEAGKHVFMEKPAGTDPVNLRKVFAAGEKATEKKLSVVAGTQRRHERNYVETVKRLHDGAIGDILHMSVYWNGGGIWANRRQPGWSDMEYQLRNWYHFVWICGDQIVEQHLHNLDVANWVLGSHPISAYGMGGRQVRKDPGVIWDHFAIEYEYPNGARVLSFCRHWPRSDENVSEFAIGSKGTSNPGGWIKVKGGEDFRAPGGINPYVQEHVDLLKSIADGKPINEAKNVAESTMTAVMGRMSAYTGKRVTWDFAMNKSKLDLMPKEWDIKASLPEPKVAEPGVEQLI